MAERADLLIVGASVRAATQSAVACGKSVIAADLFGDQDTHAAATRSEVVRDYPAGFIQIAKSAKADAFMYTGGLENWPDVVESMSRSLPLVGNVPEVLRRVRCPISLFDTFRRSGIPVPKTVLTNPPRDADNWLRKSARSCGGFSVQRVGSLADQIEGDYFQRFIPGKAVSGVFVGNQSEASFVGSTWQLLAENWNESNAPFAYCGSIGPRHLDSAERNQWQRIGDCLFDQFRLQGLFGVDAILRNGKVCPVEVNPRFVASIEVLERGLGWSAVRAHLGGGNELRGDPTGREQTHGKLYVFARRDVTGPVDFHIRADVEIADIPSAHQPIPDGHPICTTLATAPTEHAVRESLRRQRNAILRFIESNLA